MMNERDNYFYWQGVFVGAFASCGVIGAFVLFIELINLGIVLIGVSVVFFILLMYNSIKHKEVKSK